MPYFRINEEWTMPIKGNHQFRLDIREGFFRDSLRLFVDDELIVEAKPGVHKLKGKSIFMVDGRIFELRWIWNMWTGNPLSIVIMRNGKMMAMYGCEEAAKENVIK